MDFFRRKDWRDPYRRLSDDDLLNRIRTGDQLAEDYLWVTYHSVVLKHMAIKLRDKPPQLGDPDDYAKDAVLLLLDHARLLGATVLKHDHSHIGGWLKQTAFNLMQAAERKDRRNDRDPVPGDDDEENPRSRFDTLVDEGADTFADMAPHHRDQITFVIRRVLDGLSVELKSLIEFRFMQGLPWKETADLMTSLYPNNKPPFEWPYLQKTYWDRIHKKPFIKRLKDALDNLQR